MKVRNKKTGEVVILIDHIFDNYKNLAELNEEWEDYKEPKKYWFIDAYGNIVQNEITKHYGDEYTDMTDAYESQKQNGNYFETEEEAKQAVEKLKAFKRLKDKGLEFEWVDKDIGSIKFAFFNREGKITKEMWQDIDLLFGGEE